MSTTTRNLDLKGLNTYMSVYELVEKNKLKPSTGDGTRSFRPLEISPSTDLTSVASVNDKINIRLCDNTHIVTQINDSKIGFSITVPIKLTGTFNESGDHHADMNNIIHIGFDSSVCALETRELLHNGSLVIAQVNGSKEGFVSTLFKSEDEKIDRKYIHTVHEEVSKHMSFATCGVYKTIKQIKDETNNNGFISIQITLLIPLSDIPETMAMGYWIQKVMGEISLSLGISTNALVVSYVNPKAAVDRNTAINRVLQTSDGLTKLINFNNYTRTRVQIGDVIDIPSWDVGTSDFVKSSVRFSLYDNSFIISSFKLYSKGYGIKQKVLNQIENLFSNSTIYIPFQRMLIKTLPSLDQYGGSYNNSISINFSNTESFAVVFPTTANTRTVYPNPNINNFSIAIGDRLFPRSPCSSVADNNPALIDLLEYSTETDGSIRIVSEIYSTFTEPIINPTTSQRYLGSVGDNTVFIPFIAAERSSGPTLLFDGLYGQQDVVVNFNMYGSDDPNRNVLLFPQAGVNVKNNRQPEFWFVNNCMFEVSKQGMKANTNVYDSEVDQLPIGVTTPMNPINIQ